MACCLDMLMLMLALPIIQVCCSSVFITDCISFKVHAIQLRASPCCRFAFYILALFSVTCEKLSAVHKKAFLASDHKRYFVYVWSL